MVRLARDAAHDGRLLDVVRTHARFQRCPALDAATDRVRMHEALLLRRRRHGGDGEAADADGLAEETQ